MAQSNKSLHFVCRSCCQAISRSAQQTRAFSISASRSSTIPNFQPTSSAELDALLLDWRQRVFTPAALNTNHQALIYKKSRRAILENDPGVTVTMSDGEEVKLQPMEAFNKPNKSQSLSKLAKILSETSDSDAWSQLPAFLEGMHSSKQQVPVWFLEKLTRKANEQGKASVIKQCASMVKKTGLKLSLRPVTRELFLGCYMRLTEADLPKEELEEEHKFVESLALLLESKDHCGALKEESKDHVDMRRDLTVVGVLLAFAATRSMKVHGGKDVDGTVGSFTRKLMFLVRNEGILERQDVAVSAHSIEDWVPILHGLNMALEVYSKSGLGANNRDDSQLQLFLTGLQDKLSRKIERYVELCTAEDRMIPKRASKLIDGVELR